MIEVERDSGAARNAFRNDQDGLRTNRASVALLLLSSVCLRYHGVDGTPQLEA